MQHQRLTAELLLFARNDEQAVKTCGDWHKVSQKGGMPEFTGTFSEVNKIIVVDRMPSAGLEKTVSPDISTGIDAIRFSSAVLVSAFHLTWHIPEAVHVMPFGWIGVQIFFVISGIVIANSARLATPFRFAVSRFLRLYPGRPALRLQ